MAVRGRCCTLDLRLSWLEASLGVDAVAVACTSTRAADVSLFVVAALIGIRSACPIADCRHAFSTRCGCPMVKKEGRAFSVVERGGWGRPSAEDGRRAVFTRTAVGRATFVLSEDVCTPQIAVIVRNVFSLVALGVGVRRVWVSKAVYGSWS